MQSFFRIWGFLELRRLVFLGLLGQDYLKKRHNEVIKFFLIQAFRGIMIFILFTLSSRFYFEGRLLLSIILLFKIGLVPFHTWFLTIRTSFRWENLYLFLTSQKVIPLHLLSNRATFRLVVIGIIRWVISRVRSLSRKSLKKLIIYSSLFIGGILLFLLSNQLDWVKFLLVYSLIILPIFVYGKNLSCKKNFSAEREVKRQRGIWTWVIFLNLGGVPPFPGFFLKVNFLASIAFAFFELMFFIMTSIILLYIYLSLGFSGLIKRDYWVIEKKPTIRFQIYLFLQIWLLIIIIILWMSVTTQNFEFWDSKEFTSFKSSVVVSSWSLEGLLLKQ